MIGSFVFADFLTLGNCFCGTGSVLAAMHHLVHNDARWPVCAMALLPLALVFDFADGRVARGRHHSSSLGADLDSLADIVSFGLAPASLGFAVGLRGAGDVAILLYFVACGISRRARFNVTADALTDTTSGNVKYFRRHADSLQRCARGSARSTAFPRATGPHALTRPPECRRHCAASAGAPLRRER